MNHEDASHFGNTWCGASSLNTEYEYRKGFCIPSLNCYGKTGKNVFYDNLTLEEIDEIVSICKMRLDRYFDKIKVN